MVSSISNSMYSASLQATAQNKTSFDDQLAELSKAIESGDIDAIQAAFDDVKSNSPRDDYGDDPIGQFLSSVEEGLASGDISALQDAAETFAATEPPETNLSTPASFIDSQTSESLSLLLEALAEGDEDEAKSSFESMLAAISDNPAYNADDNSLSTILEQVSTALESGDTESAMTLLQTAMTDLPMGSLLNTSA